MAGRKRLDLGVWAGRRVGAAAGAADRVYRGGLGPYTLPTDHKPLMQSPNGFSCANCKHLKERGAEQSRCGHPDYATWNGDDVIRRTAGGEPVPEGELETTCTDWFEPAK